MNQTDKHFVSREMKVAIAIFSILIVGSNAGLLGCLVPPVTNVLDAALLKAQAYAGLRDSLRFQINQIALNARNNISAQLQAVNGTYLEFLAEILTSAQEDLNATEVIDSVTQLTNAFNENATEVVSQINAAIDDVDDQILDTVNPVIDVWSSRILSGTTKLICFTNELQKINSNTTELVAEIRSAAQEAIDDLSEKLASELESFQDSQDECTSRSLVLRPLCRTTVVS